ncbi:MAG: carboxyl transferase domain-containing protein, partial [Desulfobacterales bacterium]
LVVNSMKMEHVIKAEISGVVKQIMVQPGVTIPEGAALLYIEPADVERTDTGDAVELDYETPRPDLAEVIRRRALTTDEARTVRIEKRRKQGYRSTRENIDDLCDEGTFFQYGSLAVSPGYPGIGIDELLDYDASDGMVMGLAHINGHLFDETRSRAIVMAYDWTVLAGTQGFNHKLKDRMYLLADELDSPLVLFAGGGGGRAGGGSMAGKSAAASNRPAAPAAAAKKEGSAQSEWTGPIPSGISGMHCDSFTWMAKLHGRAPMVGITAGICFAGNAVLLSICDVIIATADSNIGVGGPAMIEGGGLGIYRPDEIGPMSVQVPNGVVDIAVEDEFEAVAAAKKYLSYFQGSVDDWECADQNLLRHAIPENRLRVYDIRKLIETLADTDSVLELRAGFGLTMITALARIEGRPVGIVANNTVYKGGAIDSDGADKAARFMKLCDNFNIPLVTLDDCPGIMVGPEDEKTALIRHAGRMFIVGANITVPLITVILRKSYGLGGQAMGGGTHSLPHTIVAWPTSEFGPMGLEGQVKLGSIATLQAIEDPVERQATYEKLVADLYYRGQGIWAAHGYEIDDMIDPADTRKWIMAGLKAQPAWKTQGKPKGQIIDAW